MSSLGGGRLCLELSFSTVWVMGQSVFACKKQLFASFFVFCDSDSSIRVKGFFPSCFVLLRIYFYVSLSPLHLLPLRTIIIINICVLICFGLCNHLSLFSSWSALVVHDHLFISLYLFVMMYYSVQRTEGIWRQTLPTVVWRVCWSWGSSGWMCVAGRALSTQKRLIPICLPMLKCSVFLLSSSCCSLVIAEFLSLHNFWLQASWG